MSSTYTDALRIIAEKVQETLRSPALQPPCSLPQLLEAVLAYPLAGGKALRPAFLVWSCRALGGDEHIALRAGVAIELFHTYSLVHDDIIDRDPLRRGRPSIHALMERVGREQFHLTDEAPHYGLSMALLAGDCLHSWSIDLLTQLPELGVAPELVLHLLHRLQGSVGPAVIEGEARDIQLPLLPPEQISHDDILRVINTKTSALFSYCGWAGGMLAHGEETDEVSALAAFGKQVGIAFQLQDDVLGLVADESKLGKPVGSDLREGKRTMIIALAWQRATEQEKAQIAQVLGAQYASHEEISAATDILKRLGAIDDVQAMAEEYLQTALAHLDRLPSSDALTLLKHLAAGMVRREK